MHRIALLVGTLGLLGAGAIFACGGSEDDPALGPVPDAAVEGAAASSSSSGDPMTSLSSSGAPTDGGTSSSSSSGEPASNPRQFTCGASTCDAGGGGGGGFNPNVCCQATNEAETKCARAQDCENDGDNAKLRMVCDESADCVGDNDGDVCCYVKEGNGNPSFTATCRSRQQCNTFTFGSGPPQVTPRPRICKTTAECGDAGVCNEKTCDGFKLHVCGSPAGCQ
jgi:hypothetical protein